MEWIKAWDEKPIPGKNLLMYHDSLEREHHILTFGFFDERLGCYRAWNDNVPINVSYWSYMELPPGEDK